MPPLKKKENFEFVTVPARRAPVIADVDVLVVGGGPAGMGAAVGAARAGARTVLVERFGFLGGDPTAGHMAPLMSYFRHLDPIRPPPADALVPTGQGPSTPLVAGVYREFLNRLIANGGAVEPSENTGFLTLFDPQVFKKVALDLLDDAGVDYLFYAQASTVEGDGEINGVVFESKAGPLLVKAKVTVDATGDGDVAAAAGVPFERGRPPDHLIEPVSIFFRVGHFDQEAFSGYVRQNPDDWHGGVQGLQKLIKKAQAAGELTPPCSHVMLFKCPHAGEVLVDFARVINLHDTGPFDMTRAEAESRRQLIEITAFLRKYVPGFRNGYALDSGATLVIREGRRVRGEYRLTGDDVLGARKFTDVIARCAYPIDLHEPDGPGTEVKQLPKGEAYDIPLRCLMPLGVEGLILSGRCISGDQRAESSYRINPVCMATGHAAGVAAGLSVRLTQPVRLVPVAEVQRELIRQGASLGLSVEAVKAMGG